MHMRKRITAILLLVCMTAALFWGGRYRKDTSGGEASGIPLFSRKETIYFWYTEEDLADFLNSAAVAFSEERNVRVIPQLVSESEYLEAVNTASLHSEQIPDVYLLSHDSLEKAYLAGLASEVRDGGSLVNEEHFPPAALRAVTYHGKSVAYPFYFDTTALVYNRTYLQEWRKQQEEAQDDAEGERLQRLMSAEVPQTLDDILLIGNTFDVPEGVEGIMKWDVSDIFYNYWIVGNYMIVGGEDGDGRTQIDIYNDRTLQCLESYKNLNQFFYIESDSVTYDSVVRDFLEGKTVFTIATIDIVQKLKEAAEDGTFPYEYGFAVMPGVSDTLESRSMSVTVVVNGYSGHRELANEFAAFLTGEYSGQLYQRTGRAAACLDAGQPELEAFLEEYSGSIPLPKMIQTSNLWIHLEVLFSKVWNGKDAAQLLGELSDQIQIQLGNPVG